MRKFVCFLFLFFSGFLVVAQDTIVLDRVYLWEPESDVLMSSAENFVNDLCLKITNYENNGKKVEVNFVEELLPTTSVCKSKEYMVRIKKCLEKKGLELNNIKFTSSCENVSDLKHLEPHFIWYYIRLITE